MLKENGRPKIGPPFFLKKGALRYLENVEAAGLRGIDCVGRIEVAAAVEAAIRQHGPIG